MKTTNAWVRVTETLAQSWKTWRDWQLGDQTDPEPPMSDFDKEILSHAVDLPFAFNAYKVAAIDAKEWRMGNLYHISEEQLLQGYEEHPGEWEVVGLWCWTLGDPACLMTDDFPWDPNEALLFMPDICSDPPDCASMVPATELTDVSLLAGQPPRVFIT